MTAPEEPNVDELAQRLQAALGEGYKVEKPLGAGGFAVVYLVKDLSLKRHLAVKVLSPDLITSKTVLERFKREAETVAGLSHPNIVPLHFIGEKDDLLYLAMACIDGGSVADRLEKEGPLPIRDVERIVSEVASALAHAHKRGVIHRDIKPQNVLIDSDSGRALVTDFGIARTENSSLTATGMFVGTPAYLSPEQMTGEKTDHRADIYALGVMAYELTAGKQPFEGPTPTAILMRRLSGPPEPLATIRKDVPEELSRVVDACLASDPEHRFQSASDIVAALGGDVTRTPTLPGARTIKRPAQRSGPSRALLVIGGMVLLAVIAGVASMIRGKAPVVSTSAAGVVRPTMAEIPGGTYTIGGGMGLSAPPHSVVLKPFMIDKTEVTVGDYDEMVAANKVGAPWSTKPSSPKTPVTGVLWSEAVNYCALKYPAGGRLPSEEEWEAAARGSKPRRFPWGDTPDIAAANTESARRDAAAAVGSFPRGDTPEGVQDLIGNVWEWTNSEPHAYPGGKAFPPNSVGMRVIRGGAFDTPDSIATPWLRGYSNPAASRSDLAKTGFRCARDK